MKLDQISTKQVWNILILLIINIFFSCSNKRTEDNSGNIIYQFKPDVESRISSIYEIDFQRCPTISCTITYFDNDELTQLLFSCWEEGRGKLMLDNIHSTNRFFITNKGDSIPIIFNTDQWFAKGNSDDLLTVLGGSKVILIEKDGSLYKEYKSL